MDSNQPSALILIADGTEEIEFVTPYECVFWIDGSGVEHNADEQNQCPDQSRFRGQILRRTAQRSLLCNVGHVFIPV